MFRIGHGYDVHRFSTDRQLILGGVEIPHDRGLLGHSDADVAVHALMDALLGALALGDIGKIFPDSDPKYKNADSLKLLAELLELDKLKLYQINNLDITIVAQRPRLSPYLESMRCNIAAALGCSQDWVSVKATTTECLGFCGREEGIAAYAVVLLTERV